MYVRVLYFLHLKPKKFGLMFVACAGIIALALSTLGIVHVFRNDLFELTFERTASLISCRQRPTTQPQPSTSLKPGTSSNQPSLAATTLPDFDQASKTLPDASFLN